MTFYCARPESEDVDEIIVPIITPEDDPEELDDPGVGEWEDIGSDLVVTDGLYNMAVAVQFGYLWILGGYIYDAVDGWQHTAGVQQLDAAGVWTAGTPISCARGDFQVIPYSTDRLIVIGGFDYDIGDTLGEFVLDPDDPGGFLPTEVLSADLFQQKSAHASAWTPLMLVGSGDETTYFRVPLPRDSFAACYAPERESRAEGIYLYGGRNTGDDLWQESSYFMDLWYYNGSTWELITPIYLCGESEGARIEGQYYTNSAINADDADGQYGYRYHHSMVLYNDVVYMGGGLRHSSGTWNSAPRRDVYVLDDMGRSFTRKNSDILSALPASYKDEAYIAAFCEWGDRLVALLSIGSDTSFALWQSTDGVHWAPLNRLSVSIQSSVAGKYNVSGNYTASGDEDVTFAVGDWITAIVAADEDEEIEAAIDTFELSAVDYSDGITTLTLDGVTGAPDPASGTIYLHPMRGEIGSRTNDPLRDGGHVKMESFDGDIYIIGGLSGENTIQVLKSTMD